MCHDESDLKRGLLFLGLIISSLGQGNRYLSVSVFIVLITKSCCGCWLGHHYIFTTMPLIVLNGDT